ncbi:uncharacterized protein LOC116254739 [Nymphaea colorata]|nr:uncharacterized protein LOC116254739 [Nymphaea colorata]
MASTEGLVPITRSFLARYYDKYECVPLHDDVQRLSAELREGSKVLMDEAEPTPAEESVLQEANSVPPHKIDHNLWKNREHIEEILHLLETFNWPKKLQRQETPEEVDVVVIIEKVKTKLEGFLKFLESFQAKNADHIFQVVMTYMPQDFRGALIRQQRERSERNKQAEVESLINSGGSIHDRYALLWKQQMERRRQLAQLGSATGVYKTLVKYLVGVPQVLLDFIRQINDDQGPMEEQRQRYGPPLYSLTSMVIWIRSFLLLLWGRLEAGNLHKEKFDVLEQAVNVYISELERFLKFIGEVFQNSPFFISADDACAAESRNNNDFKETMIPAGKTHEILLNVDSVNSYIAWDFSLVQGKINLDIGFSVEYISSTGQVTMILPYRRCESDQGNFCTCIAGLYKLIWDNSYSNFFKKTVRYKVDAIPPVAEAARLESETDVPVVTS